MLAAHLTIGNRKGLFPMASVNRLDEHAGKLYKWDSDDSDHTGCNAAVRDFPPISWRIRRTGQAWFGLQHGQICFPLDRTLPFNI
jgi:hypothetical protein